MNSKLKSLLALILVVFVIFTTQVSADVAVAQAAYDKAANMYSLQNHNYKGAMLKFDAVVASKDIAQVISLQKEFDTVRMTTNHYVNYCLMYNTQLQNSQDLQEQAIANNFLSLSNSFSTLKDNAADKVSYLEHVKNNLKEDEIATLNAELGSYTDSFNTLQTQYQEAQCDKDDVKTAALKKELNDLLVKVTENLVLAEKRAIDLQAVGETDLSNYYTHFAVKFANLKHDVQATVEASFDETSCKKENPIPVDNSTNTAPVLATIGNKNVVVGSTLSFTVSATDVNNDVLTYTIENKPANATFNNKVFSWTPVASEIGSYTVTFKVTDGKGGEAKAVVGITVSQNAPLTPLQEKQNEFNGYEDDYQTYKDDYSILKKKYETAVKNKDNANIKKYKNELDGLDKELKDLTTDLKILKDDVDGINGGDALYDDTKDLIKSVDTLRGKIAETLNYAVKAEETTQVNAVNTKPTTVDTKPVEVQFLNGMPVQTETPSEEVVVQDGLDSTTMALLIGGIVVLMAVIVFLLAVVFI